MAKTHHGNHYAARTLHHAGLARHAHLARHVAAHHVDLVHRANESGEHVSHSSITCEMVRAYVAQVGLAQAAAMAESAGITASEKDRAKRCLEQKS
jgi:hypothetical protein